MAEPSRRETLSYYDYLLRAIAQGDKKSIGQWNTLIRQALRELDAIMESATVYDSTMMYSFQDYQRQLAKIANDKLGIEVITVAEPPRIRVKTQDVKARTRDASIDS